jgi:Xaa-Pro aminopeptidase
VDRDPAAGRGPRPNPWFQEVSHRPIEEGALVSYDTDLIGPFGSCADLSRAPLCGGGAPSAGQSTIYRLAHQQIARNIDSLRPGMTLCIESTVGHVEGAKGVKLEEQVLVTESAVERLSSFPFEADLPARGWPTG